MGVCLKSTPTRFSSKEILMKNALLVSAAAMITAMSGVAFAGPVNDGRHDTRSIHREAGQCTAFETETPVWGYNHETRKLEFQGYVCNPNPDGGR
jgi:hypothetical protein